MSIEKIMGSLFGDSPFMKQLKQSSLLSDDLEASFLPASLNFYEHAIKVQKQEEMIMHLLKRLEEKGHIEKKIKILTLWIEIFKVTKYDLSEALLGKKIKMFTKIITIKSHSKPQRDSVEQYILIHILNPLYNFFMKFATNEQLFQNCVMGKIPEDEVFRRGTKIRYIWMLKLYNLINVLISIVVPCCTVLMKHPNKYALFEIARLFFQDILTMNNYIIQAIQQSALDNFLLMPYFDLLQFYETLSEQKSVGERIHELYQSLMSIDDLLKEQSKHERNSARIPKPRTLYIDSEQLQEIQTQALKVKLITASLKNPTKDHSRLQTEFNQRLNQHRFDRTLKTDAVGEKDYGDEFVKKYQNLD